MRGRRPVAGGSRRVVLAGLALMMAACGGETTEAPATPTTRALVVPEASLPASAPPVGTEAMPVRMLFGPSANADGIVRGGELLEEVLEKATGLAFEIGAPGSNAAVIEEMCSAPTPTVGLVPAQASVVGEELCGIEVVLKSVRFGSDSYRTQFIVARESAIESLTDLSGKSWAYPDQTSPSGFLVPSGMLVSAGVEPGSEIRAGGHTAVVRAVYTGGADFGTTFFNPATDAQGEIVWDGSTGSGDVPSDLLDRCGLDDAGLLACGDDYHPQDARRGIRAEHPDVIQRVRILTLSDPVPNDGVALSPGFPADLRELVVNALTDFAAEDPAGFAQAFIAYSWADVRPTSAAEFAGIRAIVRALELGIDDL